MAPLEKLCDYQFMELFITPLFKEGAMHYLTHYTSPLGRIMLASDGKNLVGLWNEGQKYFAASIKGDIVDKPDLPVFKLVTQWLDIYFASKNPPISELPLAPAGSEFRKAVWRILLEIPYGKCVTYGEIAKKLAARMKKESMSSQAVGGAVGHNPISIIIPCHRVVGANGSFTGYAGGIDKKIKLLELEGVDTSAYFIPSVGTAL